MFSSSVDDHSSKLVGQYQMQSVCIPDSSRSSANRPKVAQSGWLKFSREDVKKLSYEVDFLHICVTESRTVKLLQ